MWPLLVNIVILCLTGRNSAFAAPCVYVFHTIITQDCHSTSRNLKHGSIRFVGLFTKLFEVLTFPSYITAALNILYVHFRFWNAKEKLVLLKEKQRIPVRRNVMSYREGNNCTIFREHRHSTTHLMQIDAFFNESMGMFLRTKHKYLNLYEEVLVSS